MANRKLRSTPIDAHVGGRVRMRRLHLGLSQEQLGRAVGVTFQQIQKYESGANRIGAGKLYELGQALNVPVGFFYDDMPDDVSRSADAAPPADPLPAELADSDGRGRREILELVRGYSRIDNPRIRRCMVTLAKALGGDSQEAAVETVNAGE